MMFEHFTIAPYGRKDCGAPVLRGLRHEIYNAFKSIEGMNHSMIMEWLKEHYSSEKNMLLDAVSYLVGHGMIYGYYLNSRESLGAKLLKYYTPEQITFRLSKWGVKGVKAYYYGEEPCIELLFTLNDTAPEWKQIPFEQNVEGADEDLPF